MFELFIKMNTAITYAQYPYFLFRVRVMIVNATFNNISDISWQSVLLMEETGVPGENHRPVTSINSLRN